MAHIWYFLYSIGVMAQFSYVFFFFLVLILVYLNTEWSLVFYSFDPKNFMKILPKIINVYVRQIYMYVLLPLFIWIVNED